MAGNPLLSFAEAVPGGTPAAAFPGAAARLIATVGGVARAREPRVAASLVVLGYSARLLGPSLAVLLRDGVLVDASPANVRFAYTVGVGFQVTPAAPRGWADGDLAARWRRVVLDDHLAMVVSAVRAVVPVAAGLLWGNVASGLVGTLTALARAGVVPADGATAFAAATLAHGPLAGSGVLRPGPRFRRTSCCLYYRLPAGGYCGDCCFTRTAGG